MDRSAAVAAIFEPVQPPTTFEETVERLGTAIKVGPAAGRHAPPARARTRRRAGNLPLHASPGADHPRAERAARARSAAGAAAPSWRTRRRSRWLPTGRTTSGCARCSTTGWPSRRAPRCWRPNGPGEEHLAAMTELVDTMALQFGPPFEPYRRADIRFHIALAEASCSPRLVAAMTEVQGQMSELIGLIPHPEEVLSRAERPAPAARRGARPLRRNCRRQDRARAPRGHGAHPGRADAGGSLTA